MQKDAMALFWGIALLFWIWVSWKSSALSARYNAWTNGLRTRHPRIHPPPTPAWRQRNTTIMTWILRIAGAWFGLICLMRLVLVAIAQ